MQNTQPQDVKRLMQELGIDEGDQQAEKVIRRLIQDKPDAVIDSRFVSHLRQQLAEHSQTSNFNKTIINPFSFFMNNKFLPAIVLLIAVIAGGAWLLTSTSQNGSPFGRQAGELLSSKYAISETKSQAFGSLNSLSIAGSGQSEDLKQEGLGTEAGMSHSLEMPVNSNDKMMAPGSGGGSDIGIMPPYNPEVYRFSYEGEELTNLAVEQPVYMRSTGDMGGNVIQRIISAITLGLVDLGSFQDASLQNFSLIEDKEFGYSVDVNIPNGAVNIFQNWEKWPRPMDACRDDECYRRYQLTMKDMLSDEETIAISNSFVDEKRISRDGYGEPIINDQWRASYEKAEDKSSFYVPEFIDVIYPLILDGKIVIDEGGYSSGMHVNVDIRNRRVSSVYDLVTRQFQKSTYVGETDASKIIKIAEDGGFRNYTGPIERGATVRNLELDTPTQQVMRMWRYAEGRQVPQEIYVPALVFPIKNPGSYWRQNVIVPLVKEVLDADGQPPMTIMPVPEPMPMPIEGDGGIGDTPVDNSGGNSSSSNGTTSSPAVKPFIQPR